MPAVLCLLLDQEKKSDPDWWLKYRLGGPTQVARPMHVPLTKVQSIADAEPETCAAEDAMLRTAFEQWRQDTTPQEIAQVDRKKRAEMSNAERNVCACRLCCVPLL